MEEGVQVGTGGKGRKERRKREEMETVHSHICLSKKKKREDSRRSGCEARDGEVG